MGYNNAEKNADRDIRNKKEIEELEENIKGITEYACENGFTEEQNFLINYYGLDKERCKEINFNINNIEDIRSSLNGMYRLPSLSREQLENDRYKALIDLFSASEEFSREIVNEHTDMFHAEIRDWNQYLKDFEKNPIIVKEMITLQALNRMAHQYRTLFRSMLYKKSPEIQDELDERDLRAILSNVPVSNSKAVTQKLIEQFGREQVIKWKKDEYMKYCIDAERWMFKQKDIYISRVIEELKDKGQEYNYGILNDGITFDVPGYGQFSIHMGAHAKSRMDGFRRSYNLKDYNGLFLGNVYLLSKASPELLRDVNVDELSKEDKKRYMIASSVVTEKNKETTSKTVEKLIDKSLDRKKSQEIVDILTEVGIEPEKIKLETILKIGNPKEIRDMIETIKTNDYGIDTEIFYKCSALLLGNEEKAIEIMLMLDKISELGINTKDVVEEYPDFLAFSKSDNIEPIYNVLKKYKIDLTPYNIGVAFGGNAQNIKKNLDLLIENGVYDLAQAGERKFFTNINANLNMRINLFKQQNEEIVIQKDGKRRIDSKFFLGENELKTEFGIDKKETLIELYKVKGQELINENKYYVEEDQSEIKLNDKQQEMSNTIFEKLKGNQTNDGIVIKMRDYYYSAIKVKEQIDEILAKANIQDLENEDVNEILKIALLKNKNIDSKEVAEITEQMKNLERKEKYNGIKEKTNNIIEEQHNIEDIEQIIKSLKEEKKALRKEILKIEEKINNKILESDEPNSEIIKDIQNLQSIVMKQIEKRKEVKQKIKEYKGKKKEKKQTLKQEKETRASSIEELEL